MTRLRIIIDVPDTIPDRDKAIGAIITAAEHARAEVTVMPDATDHGALNEDDPADVYYFDGSRPRLRERETLPLQDHVFPKGEDEDSHCTRCGVRRIPQGSGGYRLDPYDADPYCYKAQTDHRPDKDPQT